MQKIMSRRRENENDENKASLPELILFIIIIACIYCIFALFGSSLTGEGGQKLGSYLKTSWGGPVIVPILFVLYLSAAKLLKFRIPKLRRQFFGTLMLYISFAFMLGLLKESGWTSQATLMTAGNFGSGLAGFFVLNTGTFITLLLVIASFVMSAVFFGSKFLMRTITNIKLPKLKFKFRRSNKKTGRRERKRERHEHSSASSGYTDKVTEILTSNIPEPILSPSPSEETVQQGSITFQMPKLKPAPDEPDVKPTAGTKNNDMTPDDANEKNITVMSNAVEVIDNALALIDSGGMKPPVQKSAKDNDKVKPSKSEKLSKLPKPSKKIRRPLPAVEIPSSNDTEEINSVKDNAPVPATGARSRVYDESAFPPPPELFGPKMKAEPNRELIRNSEKQAKTITSALKNFGVNASVAHIITGPSFIQYQLELAPGTKVSRVSGLTEDLAMSLAVMSVRIEAPILGTRYVGIEVPCTERKVIPLRNIVESDEFKSGNARLPLPLGVQVDGKISVTGLEELQHILIAGSTGSGRSMFVNSCILSMCSRRKPDELRLILIDPRHVEFAVYDGLPHLLAVPVSEPEAAVKALTWAYDEMEKRTNSFAAARVRNIQSFNRKQKQTAKLPEIVIVINELADLVYGAGNELEAIIMRLAQKSGASGIYMMLSSQRPSPDVFTTMVKSNIPARAVFSVSTDAESKNMIGNSDAVRLTGKGDMLFRNTGTPQPVRYQTPFVSEDKISEFVEYMFSNSEPPEIMKF